MNTDIQPRPGRAARFARPTDRAEAQRTARKREAWLWARGGSKNGTGAESRRERERERETAGDAVIERKEEDTRPAHERKAGSVQGTGHPCGDVDDLGRLEPSDDFSSVAVQISDAESRFFDFANRHAWLLFPVEYISNGSSESWII